MMRFTNRILLAVGICLITALIAGAQPSGEEFPRTIPVEKKEPRPFKVSTSGRQLTIKSSQEIKSIMIWTASGHRILEEKDIKVSSYTFRIGNNISEKIFFIMIRLQNGKLFTEKIGI